MYGRSISGAFFLKMMKDKETIQYARQHPKLPASTIHTNILRPNNGANMDNPPIKYNAFTGVLCVLCNLRKVLGII